MKMIKTKIDILEQIYFKEVENINSIIETEKESLAEKGSISIDLDKVLKREKKYEHFNLAHIVEIFEHFGWKAKIIEEDGLLDLS